jgi:threonine/homoserine/homoserine lactone efflux protein
MAAEQAIAFFLFTIVAAITPGPSNLLLTSIGTNVGVLRGLPCLCGVASGMGLMLCLVAFGPGSLVLERPVIFHSLKWCGMGVLLWLSWKIATARRSSATTEKGFVGFFGAATFQWVNPKSWLVSASAAGTYLPSPECRPASRPATVKSSSRSGQWIYAPSPKISK